MNRPSRRITTALYYWPHVGIAAGVALTFLSPIIHEDSLVGIGGNVLTVSLGVHLSRHRRRRTSDTDSS